MTANDGLFPVIVALLKALTPEERREFVLDAELAAFTEPNDEIITAANKIAIAAFNQVELIPLAA